MDLILETKDQWDASLIDYTPDITVVVAPPLNPGYWAYRVAVSAEQAIIGFPKFGTIGIGFENESRDRNRNLPYAVPAEKLYRWIEPNKGDDSIPEARCITAIGMIAERVAADRGMTAEEFAYYRAKLDETHADLKEAMDRALDEL